VPDISFGGLVVVAAIAFAAPLALGLVPRIRIPSPVVEIVLGIVVGPSVLGAVHPDAGLRVLSLIGLAFVLFLAGLEVETERLHGALLRLSGAGFAGSMGIALGVGVAIHAAGLVRSPLFVGIALLATSLGLVVPVLKDAGEATTDTGQLVIAAGTIADIGAVVLLTLFFSGQASSNTSGKLILLASFVVLVAVVGAAIGRAGRTMRIGAVLLRLQDTTAQIRVRGAVLLLIGLVALAARFGLETILGAFTAGVVLRAVDHDAMMTHPNFRVKLEGIGYGLFVPFFFVASGVTFDARALFASGSAVAKVPIFLAAMVVVRGLPAVLYRNRLGAQRAAAAGLLQATSLPFLVTAAQIGMDRGIITHTTGAALVAAGLVSVLLFPAAAVSIVRRAPGVHGPPDRAPARRST
jgi:Kef-type K+ transport system membrane component KefB